MIENYRSALVVASHARQFVRAGGPGSAPDSRAGGSRRVRSDRLRFAPAPLGQVSAGAESASQRLRSCRVHSRRLRDAGRSRSLPALAEGLSAPDVRRWGAARPAPQHRLVSVWAMGREGEVIAQLLPAVSASCTPTSRSRSSSCPGPAAHQKLLTAFAGRGHAGPVPARQIPGFRNLSPSRRSSRSTRA